MILGTFSHNRLFWERELGKTVSEDLRTQRFALPVGRDNFVAHAVHLSWQKVLLDSYLPRTGYAGYACDPSHDEKVPVATFVPQVPVVAVVRLRLGGHLRNVVTERSSTCKALHGHPVVGDITNMAHLKATFSNLPLISEGSKE